MTIAVNLDPDTDEARYFNGIVREVNVGSDSDRFRGFRLHAVSSLWLLTLAQNFRVFEKKTVPDILKDGLIRILDHADRFG